MSTPPERPDDRRALFQLELAAGEYWEIVLAPVRARGISVEEYPNLRSRYVRDVKNNPIALWCVAEWWFAREGKKTGANRS